MTIAVLPERHAQDHWVNYARCAGHPNPRLWFVEVGKDEGYREARCVCVECPVRLPCVVQAIKQEGVRSGRAQRWGMWGGTTPVERAGLALKLRRVVQAAWGPVIVGWFETLDAGR